jgi:2,3-bisphosphoglycerate-independent phosphoglycerate mutase
VIASASEGVEPALKEPIVVRLTAPGRSAFESLTRAVAERGRDVTARQHLALVIDDRIVAVPSIDYRAARDMRPAELVSRLAGH